MSDYIYGQVLDDSIYAWVADVATAKYLKELLDVSILGASNDQVLSYENGIWIPKNVSGIGVSQAYVDGSLALRDASIEVLFEKPSPDVTQAYVDASLNTKLSISDASSNYAKKYAGFTVLNTAYTVNSSDNLGVIQCDASMVVTLPDSLNAGFQTTIVNASTGWVTLNASTLLTTDSSVRIKRQYGGASAVHKGNGVWFAFGNLE